MVWPSRRSRHIPQVVEVDKLGYVFTLVRQASHVFLKRPENWVCFGYLGNIIAVVTINTLPFQIAARIINNDGAACCSGASADDYN
jgi:type IV secretory pathway TrbF-like protein